MSTEILTKEGRIKERFQPSIYFDSSVRIDYWITEGADAAFKNIAAEASGVLSI